MNAEIWEGEYVVRSSFSKNVKAQHAPARVLRFVLQTAVYQAGENMVQ